MKRPQRGLCLPLWTADIAAGPIVQLLNENPKRGGGSPPSKKKNGHWINIGICSAAALLPSISSHNYPARHSDCGSTWGWAYPSRCKSLMSLCCYHLTFCCRNPASLMWPHVSYLLSKLCWKAPDMLLYFKWIYEAPFAFLPPCCISSASLWLVKRERVWLRKPSVTLSISFLNSPSIQLSWTSKCRRCGC